MTPPRNSQLRKAAILIATLDRDGADRLLEQMGTDQAALVRLAVADLGPVEPMEQEAVIREFLHRRGGQTTTVDDGVELDQSLARRFSAPAAHVAPAGDRLELRGADHHELERTGGERTGGERTNPAEKAPFRSLRNVAPDALARRLSRENPQLIAVVLAHLPPRQSADLLGHLPTSLAQDVMQRIADVGEMDPEVLGDIERELASMPLAAATHAASPLAASPLAAATPARSTPAAPGAAVARAILAAADPKVRRELGAEPQAESSRAESPRVAEPRSAVAAFEKPLAAPPASPTSAHDDSPHDEPYYDEPPHDEAPYVEPARDEAPQFEPAHAATFDDESPHDEIDFHDLMRLDTRSLAGVLRYLNPQLALLALSGAETPFVDRILKQLPPRDAKAFRSRMQQLGPLRLSDVLEAQRECVRIAGRLAAQGKIRIPQPRRAAVAA